MPRNPIGRAIERGERFRVDDVSAGWIERRRAIVESYRRTQNATVTAQAFGISPQRVAQIVKRHGGEQ